MKRVLIKSVAVTIVVGAIVYFYTSLPDVNVLRKSNPKTSALMELRDVEYRKKGIWSPRKQVWAPYGAISEHLKKAILVSEDASFFSHKGVDMIELKEAMQKTREERQHNTRGRR